MTTDLVIHRAPWPDWFVTQDAVPGVRFCNRQGDQKVKVEPPLEWGFRWRWNLAEDILDPPKLAWSSWEIRRVKPGTMTLHCLAYSPVDNIHVFIADNKTWAYR